MADEPERRLVGVIHAELERQHLADDTLDYLSPVFSDGTCQVDGPIDLYLLARAILNEMK